MQVRYVCMYVYMYVCLYVCMYLCMYVCMFACKCVCMYVCVYVFIGASVCLCMYVSLYMCEFQELFRRPIEWCLILIVFPLNLLTNTLHIVVDFSCFSSNVDQFFSVNRVEHKKPNHSAAGRQYCCVFDAQIGLWETHVTSSYRTHYLYYAIALVIHV